MRLAPLAALAALAAFASAPATAAPAPRPAPCHGAFRDHQPTPQGDVVCTCEKIAPGPVWGSGPYTDDSSLCVAAVHAGAIPTRGGVVRARAAAGCAAYPGSVAHGVASFSWGPYPASFTFPGHGGDARCVPPDPDACPLSFLGLAELPASCTCTGTEQGPLWGTGLYTADSNVCVAARHAGVVGPQGGRVQLEPRQGCHHYPGSTRNGVSSHSWGAYERSFTFRPAGPGPAPFPTDCPPI